MKLEPKWLEPKWLEPKWLRNRLTIFKHATTVIHTTVIKSMTESKELKFVRGGMNDTNSIEESNGVFINSKSGTSKLP